MTVTFSLFFFFFNDTATTEIYTLSLHDALPILAALEAMAAGRPVVASRVGGLAEAVVHEETGLLVPPGDPTALAAAPARPARDPDLRARLGAARRPRGPARLTSPPLAEGRPARSQAP